VWLNTPRRPLEASGTSGQKVVVNGGLNLSILDGWWAEAYDGANGFAIGTAHTHSDGASLTAPCPGQAQEPN
jgi:starch phosphorylase